jgi:hypothetical protein
VAATSTAAAQAPGQSPLFQERAPEQETKNKWYGWQIIAVDAASMVLAQQGGGIGILLGSPAVHAANGESKNALKALGLRTGLPLLGFVVGMAVFEDDCNDTYYEDDCGMTALLGGLLGASLGMVTAIVVDVAYLANKDVPVERERPRYSLFDKYQPTVKFVDKGAAVGVRGSF